MRSLGAANAQPELQKLTWRRSVSLNGAPRAASSPMARGAGPARFTGSSREDGRYASFLLFEPSGFARKLRRLEASSLDSKPKNSRLADLPSAHPPCEISGTREDGPESA